LLRGFASLFTGPPEAEARAAFGMEQSAALAPDWNQFTIGAFDVANLMVA
jgi:hypothetical protein